jgi:tripartite-type tricarboxylate transporter receptor subunit TctC
MQQLSSVRRRVWPLVAMGLVGWVVTAMAQTGGWPTKPVRVIVPYTPGGAVDGATRMVMEEVAKALGQPVVVENRPGANTTLATAQLAHAPADGYTFGIVPATYTANYALFKNLSYKHTDFAAVGHMVDIPMFLFTRVETPVADAKALVAWGKAKKIVNYASTGPGSTGHFLGALLSQTTGMPAEHVPYNGSAPILADLMAGQIDFLFDPAAVPMPHARAGKLKVLAVSLPKRCACAPDVPTMEEQGFPGFVQSSWIGLLAPAGTPKAIIERMSKAVTAAVSRPEIAQKIELRGMGAGGGTPEAFEALIERDTRVYQQIAEKASISIQ